MEGVAEEGGALLAPLEARAVGREIGALTLDLAAHGAERELDLEELPHEVGVLSLGVAVEGSDHRLQAFERVDQTLHVLKPLLQRRPATVEHRDQVIAGCGSEDAYR
jgi:hypothetical protein